MRSLRVSNAMPMPRAERPRCATSHLTISLLLKSTGSMSPLVPCGNFERLNVCQARPVNSSRLQMGGTRTPHWGPSENSGVLQPDEVDDRQRARPVS